MASSSSEPTRRSVFFVSDLHLEEQPDRQREAFFRFLDEKEPSMRALYLLGDVFDFWVDDRHLRVAGYRDVVERLQGLTRSGVAVTLLHGNRDFMVGRTFARTTGVAVLPDPSETRLDGHRVLLTHGDLLCRSDKAYQRLRRFLRFPVTRWLVRFLPFRIAHGLARTLRRASRRAVSRQSRSTIDAGALGDLFFRGYDVVIHGHVHVPLAEDLPVGGRRRLHLSLGDWQGEGSYVEYREGRFQLERFTRPERPADRERERRNPGVRPDRRIVVAIDGPAASGKSTVARAVAGALGFHYLDTGALYRALTLVALRRGIDPGDEPRVAALFEDFPIREVRGGRFFLGDEDITSAIRDPEVSRLVSTVAALGRVRRRMVDLQRSFVASEDLVAEGRDMGTVVFADSPLKFFLDASVEVRARRRYEELARTHPDIHFEDVLDDLRVRDERDRNRAISPLKPARDAILVETSDKDVEEVVRFIVARVRRYLAAEGEGVSGGASS